MKIIKYNKISGGKYEVTLENNLKLKLYEDVILEEELLLKGEIDDIERINSINLKYETYNVALKYLSHHVVSSSSLFKYLRKKGFSKDDVLNTIDKLKAMHYIDDDVYVKSYINDRLHLSCDGPLKIIKKLKEDNLFNEEFDNYLNIDRNIWKDRIKKYLERQLKVNNKSLIAYKRKMLLNLVNLGYEKDMIMECLNNISLPCEADLKKREEEKIRNRLSRKYTGYELERKIKEKLYQKGFYE